jgi:hypothetical protein
MVTESRELTSLKVHSGLATFRVPSHILNVLPDEQSSPEQIAIWKAMTGVERLHLAKSLYLTSRKLKTARVKAQNPDWSDEQVKAEVARIFIHART